MLIPVGDINRRATVPFINYLLIGLNLAASAYVFTLPSVASMNSIFESFALYPNHVQPTSFLTSMFLHASPLHLFGNLLFLWIVGDNVEDRYGHWFYLAFYLVAGIIAGVVHVITIDAAGLKVPTVGASGAISGMMGAYLVLFPRARILFWVFPWSIFAGLIKVPSFIAISAWFALQVYMVFGFKGEAEPVAYWAHIGGFVFGAAATLILRLLKVVEPGNYLPNSETA